MEGRRKPELERNRRREERSQASGVIVRHVALRGRLLNFSTTGLAIESSHGLRIGDVYRLELASGASSFTLVAVVRWCRLQSVRPDPSGREFLPRFVAGLELRLPVRQTSVA